MSSVLEEISADVGYPLEPQKHDVLARSLVYSAFSTRSSRDRCALAQIITVFGISVGFLWSRLDGLASSLNLPFGIRLHPTSAAPVASETRPSSVGLLLT